MSYIEYVVRTYEDRVEYLLDNKLHRDGAPAVIYNDGSELWYQHGELHNENGYAAKERNGDNFELSYYIEGQMVPYFASGVKLFKSMYGIDNILGTFTDDELKMEISRRENQ